MSWSLGLVSTGVVLRWGLGAESFAWLIVFVFLPLCCVYYPVTTLPGWLQPVALALPPTYVFEGLRAIVLDGTFLAQLMVKAFALNLVYFALGFAAFAYFLHSARVQGRWCRWASDAGYAAVIAIETEARALSSSPASSSAAWRRWPCSPRRASGCCRRPASRSMGQALVGGPFTLTDHTGKRVTDQDFRGRYMLVFFGFTFCPDVCPSALQVIVGGARQARAQGRPLRAAVHQRRSGARYTRCSSPATCRASIRGSSGSPARRPRSMRWPRPTASMSRK